MDDGKKTRFIKETKCEKQKNTSMITNAVVTQNVHLYTVIRVHIALKGMLRTFTVKIADIYTHSQTWSLPITNRHT